MEIDLKVRDELFKRYAGRTYSQLPFRYFIKVTMWEITIKISYLAKRSLDIVVALFMILLLSPVFVVTAILIYMEDPGPIFFIQKRVGKNGKHFDFIKFRSMVVNADKLKDKLIEQNESKDGVIFKMKNDPRITRIGRFIRRYSIDELPQVFNVLKGDMSLVGPRPPVPREVAEYTLEDRKRLHVTPGITCIWQVSGRSDIPFKQQVQLDLDYIQSQSLWKDIVLLLKTIPAVLLGKGAY